MIGKPEENLDELRRRLKAAESALEAIRSGQVDTILGRRGELVVRLAEAEAREAHVKQVLLAIRNVNQLIVEETDPKRLLKRACDNLTEALGYHNAWAALFDESEGVRFAVSSGLDGGFEPMRRLFAEGGRTPCMKRALDSSSPLVVDSPPEDCPDCPLAPSYGARAGLSCRLAHSGRVYGVLSVSVPAAYARDGEELELFDEVCGDLGFALYRLELERQRKRARRELRESRERLKLALLGADLGTWDWDIASGRVVFNDRWATMLGYAPEDVDAKIESWTELVHPDDLPRAMDALNAHMRGETDLYECEHRMRHADGHWLWILDRGRVIERGEDGRPLRACGTHLDITHRRNAEEVMRLSQLLVSQIRDKVVMTDLEGRITFVNDAECRMLGRSREELLGEHITVFGSDEESRQEQRRILRETLERGYWRGEVTNYRSDGTPVVLDSRVNLLRDDRGEPVALCGISTDVTARVLAEREMRRSDRMKKLILNSTTEMVAYYDTDLRIRWANRASGDSVESDPEKLVGRHCYEVWHGSDTPCEDCPVLLARDTAEACATEQETPDGRTWLVRGYPVSDDHGEVIGMVEFGNDITQQRQAERDRARLEQQFQRAQRLESVGRLGGGVAHDLNNLLSPILGYSEMLLESTPDADPRVEQLEQVLGAARRARDLVSQLLAFSRRQTMEFSSVSLSEMVDGFFGLIRRTLRENISIELKLEEELPPVEGDRGQLEQVLLNLAVNAQDAMPEGGSLTIETALAELDEGYASVHDNVEPGSYAMLALADTGCGMDRDTLEHIFEPFFTTKEQGKGTGLGLSTAYGIVKQHDGHIWVYSEEGRGTTFRVYLPVFKDVTSNGQTPAPEPAFHTEGGNETVLLVEDDPQVGRLAREMLEQKGYGVVFAESGAEALEALDSTEHVDLLLTDIIMPDMDGRTLYGKVRQLRPGVRVLYMSGYTEDVLSEGGPAHQGAGFLQKPFSLGGLAAKVRQVLDS